MKVPDHLKSTADLILRAFPNRESIQGQLYYGLLVIFYEELSMRNLAELMAQITGKDYDVVLQDVYGVGENKGKLIVDDAIMNRLKACGYDAWASSQE